MERNILASVNGGENRGISLSTTGLLELSRALDEVEHTTDDEKICRIGQIEDDWADLRPLEDLLAGGESQANIDASAHRQCKQDVDEDDVEPEVAWLELLTDDLSALLELSVVLKLYLFFELVVILVSLINAWFEEQS